MRWFSKMMIGSVALMLMGAARGAFCIEPVPIPQHRESCVVDSGVHSGAETIVSAFGKTIQVAGVPWVRVHFSDYNLGQHSFVTITSLMDGGKQILDAESMAQWFGSSAFFNGAAVELELYVAPGDTGVFVKIEEVTVGDYFRGGLRIESICGTVDDRVASTVPRVGRIVGDNGCTGWIISNGAYLSAGHCVGGAGDILEFNVPQSLADGTIVHPGPEDQYPIVWRDWMNGGRGNDWSIFQCNPNATTGLTPLQAQNAFYRVSRDQNPTDVRVTGYGLDGPAPNFGYNDSPRNSDSRTLQTAYGPYDGETYESDSDVFLAYRVDTMNAGSGSPVIVDGTTTTMGIHTHGTCNDDGDNFGTSFENDDLENAIQAFGGANKIYVDAGHPVSASLGDGTIMRPYDTVAEAIGAVPNNGVVIIVTGSYSASAGNTFVVGDDGKRMRFEVPVGTATIGN